MRRHAHMHTPNRPHWNTQICCKIAHAKHFHIITALKGWGGSQRGEVSGASTDWLLGCPWRQHMGEEYAGLVGFFLEPILSKNHCIHRFWGSLNVLNIHWVIKTDAACDCIVLMSLEKKVETDSTSHTFKHLDIVAVQYQVRFGLLLYLSSNSLRLPCCHGNHALRCHFP